MIAVIIVCLKAVALLVLAGLVATWIHRAEVARLANPKPGTALYCLHHHDGEWEGMFLLHGKWHARATCECGKVLCVPKGAKTCWDWGPKEEEAYARR